MKTFTHFLRRPDGLLTVDLVNCDSSLNINAEDGIKLRTIPIVVGDARKFVAERLADKRMSPGVYKLSYRDIGQTIQAALEAARSPFAKVQKGREAA